MNSYRPAAQVTVRRMIALLALHMLPGGAQAIPATPAPRPGLPTSPTVPVTASGELQPSAGDAAACTDAATPKDCCVESCGCRAKYEKEEVKKDCWKTKCERICVPGIRFPWQRCGEPRLGTRVRHVTVLEKDHYTEKKYVLKWTLPECPCENDGKASKATE